MFEDKGSPCKLFDLDVENLKVVEIKKRLKALGLPVAGNKSELVERLQEAMISGKETRVESSDLETTVMPDSANDSFESKLNDEILEENSSPLKEKDLSQATQDQTVSSAAAAPVPLKKRALIPTIDDEAVKPKKRFVLKRNNFPTPTLFDACDETVTMESNIEVDKKNQETKTVESEDAVSTKSGSIKHVISFGTEPKKGLSDSEKVMMRAKRFNMPVEASVPQTTLDPAKRKQIMQWKSNVAASTPLAPVPLLKQVPNLEILKKRAERFGENVSGVLKQLEDQEKIHKRLTKFGHDMDEIKTSGSNQLIISTGSDDQEKKKKRAERFGN